jgi:hypothetical protein
MAARFVLMLFVLFGFWIQHFDQKEMEKMLHLLPYRCPLLLFTGLKCAFCGMTHSWIAMFRGEIKSAFNENAMGPVLWVLFFLILVIKSFGKKLSIDSKRIALPTMIFLLAFAIARNFI